MKEESKTNLPVLWGEPVLAAAVIINSFRVVLMLYSGSGISAISSVPYGFSEVIPGLSLGTWTYIFQGLLVFGLMVLRGRFVLPYVFSFAVISFGIALSNRCGLPIIPTDLFPRELADILGVPYARVKIGFDVICLAITAAVTGIFLGQVKGLGAGTILAAFTMGKAVGMIGNWMDARVRFAPRILCRPLAPEPGKTGRWHAENGRQA